jgi:hypothetical protein
MWVPLFSTVTLGADGTSLVASTSMDNEAGGSGYESTAATPIWIIPDGPIHMVPSSVHVVGAAADDGDEDEKDNATQLPPPGALAVNDWFVVYAVTPQGRIPSMVRFDADTGACVCTCANLGGGDKISLSDRFEWIVIIDSIAAAVPNAWCPALDSRTPSKCFIRTCRGCFISVRPDGKSEIRQVAEDSESIDVIECSFERGRHSIALRSTAHGGYMRVTASGELRWDSVTVGTHQTVEVVPTCIGVALRCYSGAYLSAMSNLSLRWTAHDVSAWETFNFVPAMMG